MTTTGNFKVKALGKALLVLWLIIASVVITLVMSGHVAPFASVRPSSTAAEFVHALTHARHGWQMAHLILEDCACSQDVARHLAARGISHEVDAEVVVLLGHSNVLPSRMQNAGFLYAEVDPQKVVQESGVEVAPTLLIIDEAGSIRYAGGYYQNAERTVALDLDILRRVKGGEVAESLPSFGCAFSQQLQRLSDPLGLKYPKTKAASDD